MVKRSLLVIWLVIIGQLGSASAALTVVGKASYDDGRVSGEYKLIYDDDLEITWLDYTRWAVNWNAQKAWAASLNTDLVVKLDPGYMADWSDTSWRLPVALDQPYKWKCDGTGTAGYNVTSSELGHLYYTELGNTGTYDPVCNVLPNAGLANTGPFANLVETWYWAGSDYSLDPERGWIFNTFNGHQVLTPKYRNQMGLGVRPGKVKYSPVMPGVNYLLLR